MFILSVMTQLKKTQQHTPAIENAIIQRLNSETAKYSLKFKNEFLHYCNGKKPSITCFTDWSLNKYLRYVENLTYNLSASKIPFFKTKKYKTN